MKSMTARPCIARLNARTFPVFPVEEEILGTLKGTVVAIEGNTDEEILARCPDADAVLIVSAYLRGPVIRKMENLKIIARLGTGIDKIDVETATRKGIIVTNSPDFSTDEVADHTMALLLASARRLKEHESLAKRGRRPDSVLGMHRLRTQTLGIVGFGRIGRAVAERARAFGLKILVYDPFVSERRSAEEHVRFVDLDTILAESDFLSLLCPLNAATRGMLSMKEFRKMKPTATLVNTGRGELIVESDLVTALNEGILRFAALDVFGETDVFAEGGFSTTHPIFTFGDNVLLTPHVSANSEESLIHAKIDGLRAVVDVLTGHYPNNVVNPEVEPKSALVKTS